MIPPWLAAIIAGLVATATDVWGASAGVDVKTAVTSAAGLIVALVAREHAHGVRATNTAAAAVAVAKTVAAGTTPPAPSLAADLAPLLALAGELAPSLTGGPPPVGSVAGTVGQSSL